ncbi:hypothetical protein [Haliea sp. E17]|uniref:hypothetical protein n=1 Tax=Haliea sp. E17 TaxID=3401576 RepID=UPI003AAB05C4
MFEHKLLNGETCRMLDMPGAIVKAEVLEIREPKNNNALDKVCRYQYGVVDEVLVERYLPSESTGDCWSHDSVAAPWWNVVGHPPHGGIVADYNKYLGGAYLRTLDPANNVVAYAEAGEPVIFDGSNYSVTRQSDSAELSSRRMLELRRHYYA